MAKETKFTTDSTFEVVRQRADGGSDVLFGNKGQESDKGHASFDSQGRLEYLRNPNEGSLGSAGGWNNKENQ